MTPSLLITWYLEMTDPAQFRPAFLPDASGVLLTHWLKPDVERYRALYAAVGGPYRWRDRLLMPDDDLRAALHRPECSVWVLRVDGEQAGYFELVREGDSSEIAYFGLLPGFTGRGLGGHLLSTAIGQAFEDGAARVWVHTCNLDAPAALENYKRRGFVVYKTIEEPMPERYREV